MQLRHFVSGSSVVLIGWLAVTFVHQVPSQAYPKLDKYPATSRLMPQAAPDTAAKAEDTGVLSVSVSR